MKAKKIHIDEENTHLFWGLISVFSIASATYLLTNAFMAGSWSIAGYTQIISLLLFTLGFYGIIRLSSPLFHFVLSVSGATLIVEIWQDESEPLDIQEIALDSIAELRIAPHSPRSPNEALYDFSTSYHLLYRNEQSAEFRRLIDYDSAAFTLKVEDIVKIIQFVRKHEPEIKIPAEQSVYFGVR